MTVTDAARKVPIPVAFMRVPLDLVAASARARDVVLHRRLLRDILHAHLHVEVFEFAPVVQAEVRFGNHSHVRRALPVLTDRLQLPRIIVLCLRRVHNG